VIYKGVPNRHLQDDVARELFSVCPFCGEYPNVFQVPEERYGPTRPWGWVIECKNMGCVFQRSSANQSIKNLMEHWNERLS
jgi:hypothetical protein